MDNNLNGTMNTNESNGNPAVNAHDGGQLNAAPVNTTDNNQLNAAPVNTESAPAQGSAFNGNPAGSVPNNNQLNAAPANGGYTPAPNNTANVNPTGSMPNNNQFNAAPANGGYTPVPNNAVNVNPTGAVPNNNQFNAAPANGGYTPSPGTPQNFNNNNSGWGQESSNSRGYAPSPNMNAGQQYNGQQYSQQPAGPALGGKGFGIAALVMGILSIVLVCCCCGPIPGVLAIVFGIIQIKRTPEAKGLAIAGIVTGAIGLVISAVIYISMMTGVNYENPAQKFYDEIYDSIYEEFDDSSIDF